MRPLDLEPSPEELRQAFSDLKDTLSPEMLSEVRNGGFRDAMIREYQDLADIAGDVVRLLRTTGFAATLNGEEADEYEQILARFTTAGERCRILVEESSEIDAQALLALAPAETEALN